MLLGAYLVKVKVPGDLVDCPAATSHPIYWSLSCAHAARRLNLTADEVPGKPLPGRFAGTILISTAQSEEALQPVDDHLPFQALDGAGDWYSLGADRGAFEYGVAAPQAFLTGDYSQSLLAGGVPAV